MQHESGRPLDLKLRGVSYRVRVARIGAPPLPRRHQRRRRRAPGRRRARALRPHTGQIIVNGHRYRLLTGTHGPIHLVEVDGVTHRVSRDEGGVVRSPAPALVVATPLAVGAEVEADAPVLVLESMKMETVLRAPFRARLKELPVSVGSQVETGAPLLRLEPLADDSEEPEAAGPGASRRARPAGRSRPARRPPAAPRAARRTCAACCSASTSTRTTSAACSTTTSPPAPNWASQAGR